MRNMYTHGSKPDRRNLTVADLRAFKGTRFFSQVAAYSEIIHTPSIWPGQTSKMITVQITDDNIHETSVKTFGMYLTLPSDATVSGTAGTAVIQISSDDSEPMASMDDVTVDEGDGTMRLILKLDRPSSKKTSNFVASERVGGTATVSDDNADFPGGSISESISVLAGDLTGEFDITIIDDGAAEHRVGLRVMARW